MKADARARDARDTRRMRARVALMGVSAAEGDASDARCARSHEWRRHARAFFEGRTLSERGGFLPSRASRVTAPLAACLRDRTCAVARESLRFFDDHFDADDLGHLISVARGSRSTCDEATSMRDPVVERCGKNFLQATVAAK